MVKSAGQVKAARKSWSLNSEYMFLTAAPHSLLSFSLPKSIWEKKVKEQVWLLPPGPQDTQ